MVPSYRALVLHYRLVEGSLQKSFLRPMTKTALEALLITEGNAKRREENLVILLITKVQLLESKMWKQVTREFA